MIQNCRKAKIQHACLHLASLAPCNTAGPGNGSDRLVSVSKTYGTEVRKEKETTKGNTHGVAQGHQASQNQGCPSSRMACAKYSLCQRLQAWPFQIIIDSIDDYCQGLHHSMCKKGTFSNRNWQCQVSIRFS
jgi:hypothetical protein